MFIEEWHQVVSQLEDLLCERGFPDIKRIGDKLVILHSDEWVTIIYKGYPRMKVVLGYEVMDLRYDEALEHLRSWIDKLENPPEPEDEFESALMALCRNN